MAVTDNFEHILLIKNVIKNFNWNLSKTFILYSNITDTRAIELLLVKGQMDLQELVDGFAQESHFHRKLDDALQNDAKPNDFVSQFLLKKHWKNKDRACSLFNLFLFLLSIYSIKWLIPLQYIQMKFDFCLILSQ